MRTDAGPDGVEEGLVVMAADGDRHPLLDPAVRLGARRAGDAAAGEGLAEALVGVPQEAVTCPVEDHGV